MPHTLVSTAQVPVLQPTPVTLAVSLSIESQRVLLPYTASDVLPGQGHMVWLLSQTGFCAVVRL